MRHLFQLFVPILLLSACSTSYRSYQNRYSFKSPDGRPRYADLDYWAAHPWKKDPSDSVPAPLRTAQQDSLVDVFFLHPTTFTDKKDKSRPNAPIDDPLLAAKTDYSTILYQASAFNENNRVFAPRYRQAHIWNFYRKDKQNAGPAFDTAYADILAAFDHYLAQWNGGRPIIIAAHSQGSLLASRLLKDRFEGKPLQSKLVVAYIPGWPVPRTYFSELQMCADSVQTGCVCSWRTFRENYIPPYLKGDTTVSFATNPLTWTLTPERAGRERNLGSVLRDFNRIYKYTTDARTENGLLYVRKPKFPGSFLYMTRNYHIGDINLYYLNIRSNVDRRIRSYWKR